MFVNGIGVYRWLPTLLAGDPRQLAAQSAVVRDDAVGVFAAFYGLVVKISAGAFQNEAAGCDVPKADATFDVSVETSRSDIDHGERGCAHDADFADFMDKDV